MIIDSHCHLHFFDDQQLANVISEALRKKVNFLLNVCTEFKDLPKLLEISKNYNNVYTSIGIHPNSSNSEKNNHNLLQDIINITDNNNKVIAIGETGLDYHYDYTTPDIQRQIFLKHIEAARDTNIPLIIHSRSADDDMIKILKQEMDKGKFTAVMHSFSSSQRLCEAALDLGLYISFSGIITFKNADALRQIAKIVPKNKILIETDAPYLAPVPMRGRKNEPSFITYTLECLSKIKNVHYKELANITTENFCHLFSKAKIN